MSELRLSRFPRLRRVLVAALLLAILPGAQAAELGEPVVRSHIGQHLIADIELTGMHDPAVPVQVRLASRDVYRGANIAVPAVLSALNLSVMRRDGRQFLHVISTRPVNAEHINLFLDLNDGARRHVRVATLWLTPDPQPPTPPAPVAPLAPVVPVAPIPAPLTPAPVVAPAAPKPKPTPKPTPLAAALRAPAPAMPRLRAAAPAACPQIDAEQLRTCAALDYKNGMLQARIVELEEKVKALQRTVEGRLEAAGPAPARPVKTALPTPAVKPAEPTSGFPWLLAVGGAIALAALAGLGLFLRRKKARLKGIPPPAARPGKLAALVARLKRKGKGAPAGGAG